MTELEIAWLAGLLEGEGCFRIHNSPARRNKGWRPSLTVKLKMTDKDVVDRAALLMKAPSVRRLKPKQQGKSFWSDTYELNISGQQAEDIMRMVLPYMGQRRSAKIIECLSTPNLSHKPKEILSAN